MNFFSFPKERPKRPLSVGTDGERLKRLKGDRGRFIWVSEHQDFRFLYFDVPPRAYSPLERFSSPRDCVNPVSTGGIVPLIKMTSASGALCSPFR